MIFKNKFDILIEGKVMSGMMMIMKENAMNKIDKLKNEQKMMKECPAALKYEE